jgi:nitroimidazol reductase NimA-like FMN-containing flavoprotein (pyridoxamine 5'-phosphate oxidase superfamily)
MRIETELQAERLESVSDAECVKLLQANDLGRIALVDRDSRPIIFPINYYFDEGVVVFRTAAGTKLDLAPGMHACFEIDGWDSQAGVGWSVLVRGIAHDVTEPRGMPIARMHYWPVRPLAPGSRQHLVGIWANEITGRRFKTAAHRAQVGSG